MSISVNGFIFKSLDLTRAWGVNPASGTGRGYGAFINPTTPVVLTAGGLTFHGMVANFMEVEDDGRTYQVDLVDNRIWLAWDTVYCSFNIVEILEDDPLTPGVDRKRKYKHIYPAHWSNGIETITSDPLTAREILAIVKSAPDVTFGWTFSNHENLGTPIFDLDASQGKTFANVLQEICERCNLICTLEGASTIRFAVKGDGVTPEPSTVNSANRSRGLAIGPPTRIRIVGDRNLYQVTPIDLEPDWNRHYEEYWFEGTWMVRVGEVFGITDPYDRAARAKEITLREYCSKTSASNADNRLWQDIGRMEMPVWAYIQQVVFRSYRVPLGFKLNGQIPLASLEIYDGLLCDLKWTTEGGLAADAEKPYPDASAFCIAKGQDIDLADPMLAEAITPEKMDAVRDLWSPLNRFRVDQKNKCFVFEKCIYVPGTGAGGLYIKANTISDDATNKYELERLVVPNANATFTPAVIRASICFAAERYAKWFGTGKRQAVEYVPGLSRHKVGIGIEAIEITYASNNKKADDLAAHISQALLTRQEFVQSGGHRRHGSSGTALNGSIDRVTARLLFEDGGEGEGISEDIDYSKERNSKRFESERELERRQRATDLFPGQKELKDEVRRDRLLGKNRPTFKSNDSIDTPSAQITKKANARVFTDSTTSYPMGMPVFGKPSADAGHALTIDQSGGFVGCIVAHDLPASKGLPIDVANSGIVDCRVKGPFSRGNSVGVTSGDNFASTTGSYHIGSVQQAYAGTSVIVAKVMLGGTPVSFKPLQLIVTSTGGGSPTQALRVIPGTLAGGSSIDLGFAEGDTPPYLLTPSEGVFVGGITYDTSTREVTSRWLEILAEFPSSISDGTAYVEIGTIALDSGVWKVTNSRYGPITANICRIWHAGSAPFYEVTWP